MTLFVLLLLSILSRISDFRECLNDGGNKKFFKVRDCAKSTAQILSFANYRNLERCLNYASSRNALAVNFSPPEASQFHGESFKSPCQVLACPEIGEGNLVNDSAYDYYSFYRNLTDDSTCIKSVGVYKLVQENANYTQAMKTCQSFNGDLAQVQSEILTNSLAMLIANGIRNWTKLAYIGMDDIQRRGNFITSFGNRLTCYKYRAWAPGHPRLTNRRNCVVLDADRTWKVTGCRNHLPFLCEIYPNKPFKLKKPTDCSTITNSDKRKTCERRKEMHREDICDMI